MSRLIIDQDWETDSSPFTLTETMARSTTNAIDGTDIRGGNGTALDGIATYALAAADRPLVGRAGGMSLQGYFKFKRVTAPSGGKVMVLRFDGTSSEYAEIIISDGTDKLKLHIYNPGGAGEDSTLVGATTLGTGARQIDFDFRIEKAFYLTGHEGWWRVWLDGTLELELRSTANPVSGLRGVNSIQFGCDTGDKTTWECIWGRMKLWFSSDPQ